MKILVPIKRVTDPYAKIRVKPDQTGVETANIKMVINPFDEIAIEQALRFKEQSLAEEVIVVSVGDDKVQETLRAGLALGADRAIHCQYTASQEPLNIAKILKSVVASEAPQLVIMGKQAIDGDNNQTGQMLAALLNWPQATFASSIELSANAAVVTREIDGGLETLRIQLPAIITTDLRLNEPRYASLPSIMKAKQKPLAVIEIDESALNLKTHLKQLRVTAPPTKSAGEMVDSVETLVDKLCNEAKVIA